MSTVKVVNVQHPSASTAAVTLAADGSMTGAFPAPNRNLLYNGAMQCHQRGTSTASITTAGYYTADRYKIDISSMGTWTQSVESDAPTGSGLRKSLKMLCTTADASPAAADNVSLVQPLEGQDLQRIAKGTASAQQLTLSFWVKSNVTGTYIAELYDVDNTRQVSASYTVSASATWEKKSITFPADTTGAFDNDNASSLAAVFHLGAGSDRTSGTLNTVWATSVLANRAVGQTNLAAATNNYWQVTGVQLEVGPVATGFEFKSFGQELRECQRYYWRINHPISLPSWAFTNNRVDAYMQHPVPMRAAPSVLDQSGGSNYWYHAVAGATHNFSTWIANGVDANFCTVYQTGLGGGAAGQAGSVGTQNSAAYLGWSAEL